MELELFWHKPVELQPDDRLIYRCDAEQLPDEPGVYVFGRMFGDVLDILYIGKAASIRTRILQHFKTNVQLMRWIETYEKIGPRVVLPGVWKSRPGQQMDKVLPIIEGALIRKALFDGHPLANLHGTRVRAHTLNHGGNRVACGLFPRTMKIDK